MLSAKIQRHSSVLLISLHKAGFMKKILVLMLAIVFTLAIAYRPKSEEVPAGNALPAESGGEWSDYNDEELTGDLWSKIRENVHWKGLAANKRFSITLVNLKNPAHPRIASINGDEMMYAASLPKIAILLAAMDALEKGELESTPEVEHDMRIMISKSSNSAASRMINRVGLEKISEVLTRPDLGLYDMDNGGGIMGREAVWRFG